MQRPIFQKMKDLLTMDAQHGPGENQYSMCTNQRGWEKFTLQDIAVTDVNCKQHLNLGQNRA